MEFVLPDYPLIIVSKLTDDIIKAAIESFINPQEQDPTDPHDELYWLKLYHLTAKLDIEEIDEILYRKKTRRDLIRVRNRYRVRSRIRYKRLDNS